MEPANKNKSNPHFNIPKTVVFGLVFSVVIFIIILFCINYSKAPLLNTSNVTAKKKTASYEIDKKIMSC